MLDSKTPRRIDRIYDVRVNHFSDILIDWLSLLPVQSIVIKKNTTFYNTITTGINLQSTMYEKNVNFLFYAPIKLIKR